MKHTITQIILGLLVLSLCACDFFKKDAQGDGVAAADTATADTAADGFSVGEGLSGDEVKALLREEQVNAGTGIAQEDAKSQLDILEEEINADIEGRAPSLQVPATPQKPPLVAKETFSADKASSDLEYDRDMAVMKIIREHIDKKKAEKAKAKAVAPPNPPEQ